jgi:hypothetical protein
MHGNRVTTAAEYVQRQVAIAVVITVKEPPLLLAVPISLPRKVLPSQQLPAQEIARCDDD